MTSRVHHALAGLQWEVGALDQALDHMHQALSISQEIGYGPGIAHGLLALSDIQTQRGKWDVARQHLQEAMTWLRLIEDQAGLAQAQTRLRALERGSPEAMDSPMAKGWVKSHVALAEGKAQAQTRLRALERGSPEAMDSPMAKGWVKSHVALAEGKVYCEFESPMAQQRS
jgi:hypothetical protein